MPAAASAAWLVDRTNPPTSGNVFAAGWRDGVKESESYAVVDKGGSLIAAISIGEVYSDSYYPLPLPQIRPTLAEAGMRILSIEEYEFARAIELGGESGLEEFHAKYPRSPNRKTVIKSLDEARFRLAELSRPADAYREFRVISIRLRLEPGRGKVP